MLFPHCGIGQLQYLCDHHVGELLLHQNGDRLACGTVDAHDASIWVEKVGLCSRKRHAKVQIAKVKLQG